MPSVCELKAMCKAKGIRGFSNKPKKELERMLSEHGSAPAPASKKTPDDSVEKAAAIAKLAKIRAALKARKAEKKVPKATPTPVKVEEKATKPNLKKLSKSVKDMLISTIGEMINGPVREMKSGGEDVFVVPLDFAKRTIDKSSRHWTFGAAKSDSAHTEGEQELVSLQKYIVHHKLGEHVPLHILEELL